MSKYNTIATDAVIQKTAEALKNNGMTVHMANDAAEAKEIVLGLLPKGAEVMDMTSATLDAIGISAAIQNSGDYISARKISYTMDLKTQQKEIHGLRSTPVWTIGSVHALTQEGSVMVASQSGSQLAAYSFGADNVIWVIGAQKIVENREEGFKRIYEHCLPLESERARKAYGVPASSVNKIFILDKEVKANRITIIIVKETLGF